MSQKDFRSGHNVRFEPRTLDERMEDIFDQSDKLSYPRIKDEEKQPDPDAHHFDESDYQLHRKESYPQMHNLLKPMYSKPTRRKKPSASTQPTVSELDNPTEEPDQPTQHSDIIPPVQIIDPKQKVQFYFEEEGGGHPEDLESPSKKHAKSPIPSSPSNCSVEALAFQTQSPDEPIPSSIHRHKIDDEVPSDKPTLSLRASGKLGDTNTDQGDSKKDDNRSPFKKSNDHKKPHRRKISKQENPIWRQRIGSELDFDSRIPIIDEDESATLPSIDIDYMTSHRFDEVRGARRYKIPSKIPSKTSLTSYSKIPQSETDGSLVAYTKKSFDHQPHEVFVQLNELHYDGHELEWTERARFIKYEEDVEEGSDKWGKPHIASLSFHSLLNLRLCLEKGVLLLDLDEFALSSIYNRAVDAMIIKDRIRPSDRKQLFDILMLHHSHMNDKKFDLKRHNYSYHNFHLISNKSDIPMVSSASDVESGNMPSRKSELNFVSSAEDVRKQENSILRRIPIGSEAIAVNVGAVDFLEQPAVAFIRLSRGQYIPSVMEVTIPVRFFFILLCPRTEPDMDYHEIGRSISALMKNEHFYQIAYKASERRELLSGINEFLDESIVLPPGDWNKRSLLPVHDIQKKQADIQRRRSIASQISESKEHTEMVMKKSFNPLHRTRRLFGGLKNEIRNRYPLYVNDLKDALNSQCFAAVIFMYFAALSGAVTFGGLYGEKTSNMIGVTETLLLNSICGIIFSLVSCQPTVIIGPTGPGLLFDESLFNLCQRFGFEFLTLRIWIGIWMFIIAVFVVAFEGSALLKFFTRFCQDIFATLISLLFIYEAVYKLYLVFQTHPLKSDYCSGAHSLHNATLRTSINQLTLNLENITNEFSEDDDNSTSVLISLSNGDDSLMINQPNTALIATIMMLGTFFIAYYLRHFRNSKFLGRSARRAIGDFGVPIAIVSMAVLDIFLQDTYTMKLRVPEGMKPSNSSLRGWLIPPMGLEKSLPIWHIFVAILPAMLLFILFFMETEICQLILSKKLKKGTGFHVDLLVLCFFCMISGFFGGPWLIAATVRSVTHVSSLTVLSRTHAPGENPKVIDVKDQRVSAFTIYLLVGLSVLMASVLSKIPVAVLFGIFLYMGVSSLNGIQFVDRVIMIFKPVKHHPDIAYVRKVRTLKMHLFTLLQIMCIVILWIIKSSAASLSFPFVLILMIPLRFQLNRIFTPLELKVLDCDEAEPDLEEVEPDFYEASRMAN